MYSTKTEGYCLHELFESQLESRATQPAVLCASGTFTYQDIEHRANQVAHFLKKIGVRPGAFVGLYFKRSEKPIIAMLAILKSGAAYVPIDPQFPIERIRYILENTNVSVLLTDLSLAERAGSFFKGTTIVMERDERLFENEPTTRISRKESGVTPEDLCYIIYTSGTTGRPKGVMTRHRNVVSFTEAFNEMCDVTGQDRIYHGFSMGFDGSVEEIWMAFAYGAALVVGPPDIGHDAHEVALLLTEHKVTYFSTVPTFLSMIDTELPTVRLLIVSGEQCPFELATKWSNHGRCMLNVYGPTETTVNTTVARCAPGKKITIGKPLRGYDVSIRDTRGNPVPAGETGELYIGGSGVSRGYMNNTEMTARHFIPDPCAHGEHAPILYKTGDLVHYNEENELVFLGRIDTQVKIRGYRIELAEIESLLIEHPEVQSAAVKVYERDGLKELAAFVVKKNKTEKLNVEAITDLLQKRLPAYMVPAFLDELPALPVLTSGKIDRTGLPEPKTVLRRSKKNLVLPATATERMLVGIWEKIFAFSPVSVEDDFFLDLGGYSLLAAQMISRIRNELNNEITIRDVYLYSTLKKLAAHIDGKINSSEKNKETQQNNEKKRSSREVFASLSRRVRWSCYSLQALSLYCMYALGTIPLAAVFLLYISLAHGKVSLQTVISIVVVIGIAAFPVMIGISIIAKWLIIGRYKPGEYKIWGWYYFRWWLVTRLQTLSGAGFLVGTPMMNGYFRLMGAKIGKNCLLATAQCYIFDLLTVGSNSSICAESQLLGYRVEDGLLKIGHVTLGENCFVGISSTLGLNTRMENGALLDDLSLLPDGHVIPAKESRSGSPCRPSLISVPAAGPGQKIPRNPVLFGVLHLGALYGIEFFMLLASLPTLAVALLAYRVDNLYLWIGLLLCAIPLYEISFCLMLAAVKWIVLGRARPGVYPVHSWYYVRNWYVDTLLNLSRFIVLPVYTTLYYLPWIRMLGARVGARAEFSVISQMIPDITTIGEESFLADGSIIGGMRYYNGLFQLEPTRIGRRTFVGNSAVLPAGSTVGDNCLIGVLSVPPSEKKDVPHGTEWLGSPSFNLPHRKKVEGFSETTTFMPTKKLYAHRLLIDALRICIPSTIEIFGVVSLFALIDIAYISLPMPVFAAVLPLITCLIALIMALCVVGVKNICMGQFTPTIKPLWSPYVWFNEVVNGAYEAIAAPVISMFFGTPFIAWYLRLLGCKIGKHAFIETALFGEFDLVRIGDYTALNSNTIIQNHLFEDRIFKASTLTIGDECSTGNMSVVLYDSEMRQGSSIGPLSLVMKSETLPSWTAWTGIPVEKNDQINHGSRTS